MHAIRSDSSMKHHNTHVSLYVWTYFKYVKKIIEFCLRKKLIKYFFNTRNRTIRLEGLGKKRERKTHTRSLARTDRLARAIVQVYSMTMTLNLYHWNMMGDNWMLPSTRKLTEWERGGVLIGGKKYVSIDVTRAKPNRAEWATIKTNEILINSCEALWSCDAVSRNMEELYCDFWENSLKKFTEFIVIVYYSGIINTGSCVWRSFWFHQRSSIYNRYDSIIYQRLLTTSNHDVESHERLTELCSSDFRTLNKMECLFATEN